MTRSQLFQIRFAATAGLLLLAFLMVRFLWFPSGYFGISGVAKLFLVLVGVNFVVGPVLSTILFKPGKWGLKFDLVVVACVEVAILMWGLAEIHERRPAFAVFAVDRFEAVTQSEVDPSQLAASGLDSSTGFAPRLVYAELPTDIDVMNQLIDDTVFLGKKDIDRRPEFWKPYATGMRVIKAAVVPVTDLLLPQDDRATAIQSWLERNDAQAKDYTYLPIQGWSADGIVILHADIGYPVTVLAIDPWSRPVAAQ
ncbi:MAG: hypothetical protein ACR2QT_09710 [Woeseiaceae bacterium]